MKDWIKTKIHPIRRIDCRSVNSPGEVSSSEASYIVQKGLGTINSSIGDLEPGLVFITIDSGVAAATHLNLTADYRIQSVKLVGIRPGIVNDLQVPKAVVGRVYLRPSGLVTLGNFPTNLQLVDPAHRIVLCASSEMGTVKLQLASVLPENHLRIARNIIVGISMGQLVEIWITDIGCN